MDLASAVRDIADALSMTVAEAISKRVPVPGDVHSAYVALDTWANDLARDLAIDS